MPAGTAVIVDTDIFSVVYIKRRANDPVEQWQQRLRGKKVLISFQTRAEVLLGLRASNWGERRIAEATSRLDRVTLVPADAEVIDAFATLGAACKRSGHPLWGKQHTGDCWVAACAIAKGIPLLARDRIYLGAPRLELLSINSG